MGKGNL